MENVIEIFTAGRLVINKNTVGYEEVEHGTTVGGFVYNFQK